MRYALSVAEENQAKIIILQPIPLVPWQYRASEEESAWRTLLSLVPPHAADWCTTKRRLNFIRAKFDTASEGYECENYNLHVKDDAMRTVRGLWSA